MDSEQQDLEKVDLIVEEKEFVQDHKVRECTGSQICRLLDEVLGIST